MPSNADLAAKLYPSMVSVPTDRPSGEEQPATRHFPTATPAALTDEERVARMYPSTRASAANEARNEADDEFDARGWRRKPVNDDKDDALGEDEADERQSEQTTAEKMYGSPESLASQYGPTLKTSLDKLAEAAGLSDEERQSHLKGVAQVFADAQISPTRADRLYSLMTHHIQAPADDAQRETWERATNDALRARYHNDTDAQRNARLDKARAFVRDRPELGKLLVSTGLGSHPDIVLALVENALHLRTRSAKR